MFSDTTFIRNKNRKDEIDSKKMQQIESRLSSLVNTIKTMKQKCESSEYKEIFDTSFHENLKKSIANIELVRQKEHIEETGVIQMEENLSAIAKDVEQKISAEQAKFRAIQEETAKNEQIKRKFQDDLKISESKYNDLIKSLMSLIQELKQKIDTVKNLTNPSDLLNQAKQLFDAIEPTIKECEETIEQNIKKNYVQVMQID